MTSPAARARLPVTLERYLDETTESWLERLAEANHLTHPALLRIFDPDPGDACSTPRGQRPDAPPTGWTPGRGTQLCPACLTETGVWRQSWRHPMTAICLTHRCWLHATCPTCRSPFRSHSHHRLRSVDARAGTCGNPTGHRGRSCPQDLGDLPARPADADVEASQRRIHAAVGGDGATNLYGRPTTGTEYLAEVRALAVLLLHLSIQPGGDAVAEWAEAARTDTERSPGPRSARWFLAPPVDPHLRGRALAAADHILAVQDPEEAADRLHPWIELTPDTLDGQLGWLADHTRMTPLLTRQVLAATANRRRVTTLLDHDPPRPSLLPHAIPQCVPREPYRRHHAQHLDAEPDLGPAYAALCLVRRHTTATTWAQAAALLGLPTGPAIDFCRRGSSRFTCRPDLFVAALDALAADLANGLACDPASGHANLVDYRAREDAVRRLANQTRWYRGWPRAHHPGSRATSRPYAVTWLWTHWAFGLLATSPGWPTPPDHARRSSYRRYASRLAPAAREALVCLATAHLPGGIR